MDICNDIAQCLSIADVLLSTLGLGLVLLGEDRERRLLHLEVLLPAIGILWLGFGLSGLLAAGANVLVFQVECLQRSPVLAGHLLAGIGMLTFPLARPSRIVFAASLVLLVAGVAGQSLRLEPLIDLVASLFRADGPRCECESPFWRLLEGGDAKEWACVLEPLRTFGPPAALLWSRWP